MMKKKLKKLELNKKSISVLDNAEMEKVKGASLWYCDSEGMGCILQTRTPVTYCRSVYTCPADSEGDYSCQCTIA